MSGAVQPASRMRCLISATVAAASGTLTVMRTISEPASASAMHCAAVAAASAVSVLVIDWTTTGAPPPTCTAPGPLPTRTPTVRWTRITDMGTADSGAGRARASAAVGEDVQAEEVLDRGGRLARQIDERHAGDVDDVVLIDDRARVDDARAHRDDRVVERQAQVV